MWSLLFALTIRTLVSNSMLKPLRIEETGLRFTSKRLSSSLRSRWSVLLLGGWSRPSYMSSFPVDNRWGSRFQPQSFKSPSPLYARHEAWLTYIYNPEMVRIVVLPMSSPSALSANHQGECHIGVNHVSHTRGHLTAHVLPLQSWGQLLM